MKILILSLVSLHMLSAFASVDIAKSMVPRGKLEELLGRDVIIKTKAGTKIDIEFSRDGKFEEAFGKNLNKGDELEPGDGLISLSSVARIMEKAGHEPEGHWMLEKDPTMGWIYEVNGTIVSAKSGVILRKVSETAHSPENPDKALILP